MRCGGGVFFLLTLIYRKPFHRNGIFLESDQSSPRLIFGLLAIYLAVIRQINSCQSVVWQSLGETAASLLVCHLFYISVYSNDTNVTAHPLVRKGHFCCTYMCSVGSVAVTGNPWKLVTFVVHTAFLSSFFFAYSVHF